MRIPTVTFLCMFIFVDRPTCLYVKYVICRKNRYYFITYRIFLPFLLRKFKRLDFRNTTKHFPELKSTNHGKKIPHFTEFCRNRILPDRLPDQIPEVLSFFLYVCGFKKMIEQ